MKPWKSVRHMAACLLFVLLSALPLSGCTVDIPPETQPAATMTPTILSIAADTPAPMLSDTPANTPTVTPTGTPALTSTATPFIVDPGVTPCASLKNLELEDTTITISEIVWPGGGGKVTIDRIICRVAGRIAPSIKFEVWLPLTTGENPWNGRFNGVGNTGLAGSIRYDDMLAALKKGYATASTDTGHQAEATDGEWMRNHPELWEDFSYRAIHMMTLNARAFIQAYYGQAPQYSYFTGCSGGGEAALAEAQRYPADYDGLVAGAPANYRTHSWPGEIWPAYVTHRSAANAIPQEKLAIIHQGALAACDANDGLVDGVINDPPGCNFDPSALLCQGADGPDCLTEGEADSVRLIYAGLNDPTSGGQFWPGLEPGGELGWIGSGALLPEPLPNTLAYFKSILFAENPDWDWSSFDFTDPQDFAILVEADASYGPIFNATDPDLSAFRALGGKLIMYHGWADQQIAPQNSINYYNSVVSSMGGEAATQEFLRLFMVPGMMHCGGGAMSKLLAAVQRWVEQGTAPVGLKGPDDTRPLCAYPQVARYTGTGSTENADNFVCATP